MVGHGRGLGGSGLVFAGFLALAALVGCGGSGGGGNAGPTIASCNAWCDALAGKSCASPLYDTAEECKASECAGLGAEPARCLATTKAYYDCRAAQADLCADTGCSAEGDADLNCLLGGGGGTGGGGGGGGIGGGGGGSSGFTPAAFGTRLVVWLDAARGVTGSPVTRWADQSGAGNDAAQTAAGSQPALTAAGINGMPALTFNGQATFLRIADSATTRWGTGAFTVMVVARGAPNTNTNAMLYQKSEADSPFNGLNLYLNSARASGSTTPAGIQVNANAYTLTADDFGDDQPHLFGGRLITAGTTNGLLDIRVDGVRQGAVNFPDPVNIDAPGRDTIIGHNGYNPAPGLQAFAGDIAEIVAVKGTVSDAELASLEAYLMDKYGL